MDSRIETFLSDSAKFTGTPADAALARILHVDDMDQLAQFLPKLRAGILPLLAKLDLDLRLRNPGLHYVERKTYVGYRREVSNSINSAERSQVFLSVLKNSRSLEVVLPLDPFDFESVEGIRNLSGRGHHGVGQLLFPVASESDIQKLMKTFDGWLRPHNTP